MTTNIVILNYRGKEDTLACLDSLDQQSSESPIKVLLVNNSREEHFEQVDLGKHAYAIEYIEPEKNLGFCAGNNLGIQKSLDDPSCDHVMLLNNDTVVAEGAMARLRSFCERNPDCLASPVVVFHSSGRVQGTGGDWSLLWGYIRNLNKGKAPSDIREDVTPFYLSGCCMMAHKEVFRAIGLFDEDYFTYGEDLDLSIRARRRGFRLRVLKDAIVYHKHSRSSNAVVKHYRICRSNAICVRKNYGAWLFYLLCPVHAVTQAAVGFLAFRIRNPAVLWKGILAGFSDGIRGRPCRM
ncbi:MAG: glycosyltransferase family 2 protein [Kiritimatiellae bacterium]|nr:glycosyltransferase family 2 protein [Kiritimatiellia bacterium]